MQYSFKHFLPSVFLFFLIFYFKIEVLKFPKCTSCLIPQVFVCKSTLESGNRIANVNLFHAFFRLTLLLL
jgi:hypothetical protein